MKNTIKKLTALALVALMLFALVSCDKSGSIKKAYEKKDYTVTVVDKDNAIVQVAFSALSDEQKEELSKYELISCKKGLVDSALIIKFPSEGAVKDFLTVEKDGKKDTSAYDAAKKDGKINGNCYLIYAVGGAKDIFN